MKNLFSIIFLIILSPSLIHAQLQPQWKNDSIEILASLEILYTGCMPPPNQYEERLIMLTNMIYEASLDDLKKLITQNSDYIKTYAFISLCNSYFEHVEKSHKEIYKSKTPIVVYSRLGNKTGMTAGQITSHYYRTVKKNSNYMSLLPKVQKAIKQFISKYALFPDTYKELGYQGFQKAHMHLRVDHIFRLENKKGVLDTVKFNFVVDDKKYKIQAIEPKWQGTIKADPPKIETWIREFGRTLSSEDSLHLGLKR